MVYNKISEFKEKVKLENINQRLNQLRKNSRKN